LLAASSLEQAQEVLHKALLVHDVASTATENAVGLLQQLQTDAAQQHKDGTRAGAVPSFTMPSCTVRAHFLYWYVCGKLMVKISVS
jgi:hypothetical protein